METLSKLFGSPARVKVLKLFIFNPEETYETKDVAIKAKISHAAARGEINLLKSAGLVKKKTVYRDLPGEGNGSVGKRRKISGYALENDFHYLVQLRGLLGSFDDWEFKAVERKIQKAGKMKLIILSGFFIQDLDSRVDLLVVGDHISKKKVENAVKAVESEIGRELRCSIFETPEFQYRMSIYDRLVRDILDYPHRKVLNKLGI